MTGTDRETNRRGAQTRAQQIRQRRAQEAAQPRQETERPRQTRASQSAPAEPERPARRTYGQRTNVVGSMAQRPYSTPTPRVVSRHGLGGQSQPVHQTTRTRMRQQRYFSLNAPGAEVRLPALPTLALGWRGLSGALVVILAFAAYSLWNSSTFQVHAPQINGTLRIPDEEISKVLNLEFAPVVELVPAEMEAELLESFPDLSAADVQVGLPNKVTLTLVERQPVLAWQQGDQVVWIDEQGVAFPPRGDAGVALPTVVANAAPPKPAPPAPVEGADAEDAEPPAVDPALPEIYMQPELIEPILAMSAHVPEGTALQYDPQYGLGWNDPRGWRVYFGMDVKDIDLKLKGYESILTKLSEQGVTPTLISMEFLHAPFYRLEQ